MSDVPTPPPPPGAPPPPFPPSPPSAPGAPRPFAPGPKPLPGGCSRPILVGCSIFIVLLGIAGIAFVAKAKDLLAWTMREVEKQVTATLPGDVTAEERARLERGFDAAVARMQRGEVETPALYALQSQLMNAADKSQKKTMSRDDVLDLLSALERVGGLLGPVEGEEPRDPAERGAAAEPETSPPADGSPSPP